MRLFPTKLELLVTVLLAIPAAALPAHAQSLPSQVEIHGFGSWAYRRTNTNEFLGGVPQGSYRSVDFALAVAAAVQTSLTIDGQVHFAETESGELVDVDYAFAEWRFSDALRLRAGKMKLPFGIYSEVFHVGTIRPFPNLPQAVYGPTGFISQSAEGLGVRGAIAAGRGWDLHYDVYGGGIKVPENDSTISLAQNLPPGDEAVPINGEPVRDVIGGRLNVLTPLSGLRFGVSAYSGVLVADSGSTRKTVVGAHAEYLTDQWWLRSEFVHEVESNRLERVTGMYVEAARFLNAHWQLAALYDRLQVTLPDVPTPPNPSFLKHREFAFGINYWFTPEFVLKSGYSFISGNRYASLPVDDATLVAPKTRLLQVAAEFSF